MKLEKVNVLVIGTSLIFAGFLLLLFEDYRNSQAIEIVSIGMLMIGWAIIYSKVIKNTIIGEKTVSFSSNKLKWVQQKVLGLLSGVVLVSLVGGSIYYAFELGHDRIDKILNDGPSKTTVAEVTGTETRTGRSSTRYYAVFEYQAGNENIEHLVSEDNRLEYIVTQKYEILYSVDHPEMFRILRKVR